jgi:hypothetical protein
VTRSAWRPIAYAYALIAVLILLLEVLPLRDPYPFLLVLLLGTPAMVLVVVSGVRTARNIRPKPPATPLRQRLAVCSVVLVGVIVSVATHRAGVEQPVPGLIVWGSIALAMALLFGLERRHRQRPPD